MILKNLEDHKFLCGYKKYLKRSSTIIVLLNHNKGPLFTSPERTYTLPSTSPVHIDKF